MDEINPANSVGGSTVTSLPLPSDPIESARLLNELRPADAAEALNSLDRVQAACVIEALPPGIATQVFNEPHLDQPAKLIEAISRERASAILAGMHPDRRAAIFRYLSETARAELTPRLDAGVRATLTQLLSYPAHSAGGIMTTDFIGVPADWTVGQTLQFINKVGGSGEEIYSICLLDPQSKVLRHVVSLRRLVISDPAANVLSVTRPQRPITVTALTDREEVARLISKYDLLAVPVLADDGHVLGIVTVDDVIDAIIAEGTEDVQKFGGSEALDGPYLRIGFVSMIRKRAGWLCALFLSEMLTATAMQGFQSEIEKAVVLTLFIPLIMSSGGNSGSQATSLVIRALALKELSLGDWWRVASRELPAGLSLGAILGIIGMGRIALWQWLGLYNYGPHWGLVAVTIGLALTGIVAFGSMAGSMLPFVLRRLGFDPAVASAPFVATLVDVTGLVIYFSVAYLVLRGTLL